MADYGTKFRFRWQAANGADYEIDIKEKGYSGTVYDRAMGAAPQLKRENNGHIYGTSLDIYAECKVDGEFSSLYTSDPTMYQVELYQGAVLMWIGFVSPELYSEPDIAPPYDVTIVATDCLGELKLHDWAPTVKSQAILAHLNYLMSFSGLDLLWRSITSMRTSEAPYRTLLDTATVDLSDMEGKTCYEVLESILTSINANITQQSGNWLLFRRNDAVFTDHTSLAYDFLSGGKSGSYPVAQVGTMRSCAYWPVGQLTSEIEPAVKSVTVKAPNYYKESAIKVEDFAKNDYAAWLPVSETRDRASWKLEGFHSFVDPSSDGSYEGSLDKVTRGVLSQSISFEQATPGLALTLEIGSDETMGSSGLTCRAKVYYTLDGTDYYLGVYRSSSENWQKNYWHAAEGSIWATVDTANEISTTEFYLPPMPAGVTLTVVVEGSILPSTTASYVQFTSYLYGAYLTYASEFAGQQLKVNLSNNAREDLSEIESVFSTWSSDSGSNPDVLKFRNGIVALDGAPVTNWQSAKLGAQDYLGFITMDYALESALPRLVKTGKIWFPAPLHTSKIVPIAFYDGQYDYLVDTFTLDLVECEMDVKMTSLPAASLTVESQERTAIPESGSASSRGSSGSSGGGSSAGGTVTSVGLTMPDGFTTDGSPVTTSGTINVALDSNRVLPTTTQTSHWDSAYNKAHPHSNKTILDALTATKASQWDTAYSNSHSHSNKSVLDTITSALVSAWNSAVAAMHSHTNLSTLEGITSSRVQKWDNAASGSGGTVTSVGMTVPTGLSVSGSPVTSSGTLAVKLASGYTIPKSSTVHTHDNKTVLDDITTAKVAQWDAASGGATEKYCAPRLKIIKSQDSSEHYRALHVEHPYLGTGVAVLMVYAKNNSGSRATSTKGSVTTRRKKGWCEARGTSATSFTVTAATTSVTISLLTSLPQFIMRNYVRTKGYTMSAKRNMTMTTWRAIQRGITTVDKTYDGFDGDRAASTGSHTRYYKRFGIAVRWDNPSFSPSSSKSLTNNTMRDSQGHMRYIYSEVAPLDCYIEHFQQGKGGVSSDDWADICFGLAGR